MLHHIMSIFVKIAEFYAMLTPLIALAAVMYFIGITMEKRRLRREAVACYANQFGVTYEEADKIVYTDPI